MKKNIFVIVLMLAVIVLGGMLWKNNHTISKNPRVSVQEQNVQPVAENATSSSDTTSKIPANWKEYQNPELHFAFSYPIALNKANIEGFDTNAQRTGNQFGATFYNDATSLIFGASSPDYNPNVGRGAGGVDMFRDLSTWQTNENYTVSSIQSNGVKGKLISGTEKCGNEEPCTFAEGTYMAIFPVPSNDRGIQVMGFFETRMSKDDFLKIIATFKQI